MAGRSVWIALLRGVMPATHKVMSMAALRDACAQHGLVAPRTYIASGNLLFRSALDEAALGAMLRDIITGFGLDLPVFLRRPEDLDETIAALPFAEAAQQRPSQLHVSFMATEPPGDALGGLVPDGAPEKVALAGRALFVDYCDGAGRSKLTPARIARYMGQPGTARNWTTVLKLRALCD